MTPSTPSKGLGDCPKCAAGRLRAEAAGHRDWHVGVCWDHAGVDLSSPEMAWFSEGITEDHRRKACREMGLPYVAPGGSAQPDLFERISA